ncbi:MAG: hypothetical protein M3268_00710 [Acidobacteriota bacterium]|nr:hypothetical protein [Acidobacteriota bacterium]
MRAPLVKRIEALRAELDSIGEAARKKAEADPKAAPSPEDEARLLTMADEADSVADQLDAEIEKATREVYAAELANNVLVAWGLTHEGSPVPITFEVLKDRPLLLLQDVFQFARESSLPKSRRGARTGSSLTRTPKTTVAVTSGGSSSQTTPQPSDRIM